MILKIEICALVRLFVQFYHYFTGSLQNCFELELRWVLAARLIFNLFTLKKKETVFHNLQTEFPLPHMLDSICVFWTMRFQIGSKFRNGKALCVYKVSKFLKVIPRFCISIRVNQIILMVYKVWKSLEEWFSKVGQKFSNYFQKNLFNIQMLVARLYSFVQKLEILPRSPFLDLYSNLQCLKRVAGMEPNYRESKPTQEVIRIEINGTEN